MERRLIYTTTGLVIMPYEPKQCRKLEWMTSTYDAIYHRAIPHTGFYNPKMKAFATYNLGKTYAKTLFPDYEVIQWPVKPIVHTNGFEMKNITLNEYQEDIATKLESIESNCVFVNLPTAVGKTIFATTCISEAKTRAFVMCYTTKILDQWVDTFKNMTTLKPSQVMMLTSSKQIDKIYKKPDSVKKVEIFLCTTSLFDSYGRNYGYERYFKLFQDLNIGMKVIDEAHTRLGTTVRINAYTNVPKTMYLSADYNQANTEMLKLFKDVLFGVPVLKLSDEHMSELKHINAVVYSFNSRPSINDELRITAGVYHWSNIDYCRYEFDEDNSPMIDVIIRILKSIVDENAISEVKNLPYKVLILVQLIEHVDKLALILPRIVKNRTFGAYYSEMSDDEKSRAVRKDIIISTYKSFSTGVNLVAPEIKDVISTCPVDIVTANQSAGRCRPIPNTHSRMWLVTDYGFEHNVNNIERTVKYLTKNKVGEIIRQEYDDE